MTGTLYAMITTEKSNQYTSVAIDSFLKSTRLDKNDEFVLIDNDNEGIYTTVDVIRNESPKSFAKNCNDAIKQANGKNFVLLSNDVVFTPDWNRPLEHYSNAIFLPSCNQTHLYTSGALQLQSTMQLHEYAGRFNELANIARTHKTQNNRYFEQMLMPFYVFRLPRNVYDQIGLFDEGFGIGGGEDVDYRIRAIAKDVPVKYSPHCYLLHFQGKSTWDGSEARRDTSERNRKYFSEFVKKWGEDLANLCLVGGNPAAVIEKYQLYEYVQSQEFSKAIKVVLNTTHRN